FVVHRAVEGYTLMLEKVRLQKELIETKNFLESIVEKAGDAISVIDLEGRILYWNEGAERIYGYPQAEALGKKLSEILYPQDEKARMEEDKILGNIMALVKKGEVASSMEIERLTKDGREIITSMTTSPLKDAEGRIIGASRICRDITSMKKADVRFIAATNKDLKDEVKKGNFRADLYFRLNVVHLFVAPLRDREEDIMVLFRFFMDRFNEQFQKGFAEISRDAEDLILSYPWPGNVRELRNAVERIILLEKGDTILPRHLAFLGSTAGDKSKAPLLKPAIPPQGIVLDEVMKEYIQ
ncbi:MAG: PAS domain S-box protein, partial [Thermodesulfobacteriota bacterium]|nr:PAS domain S-box protein [Thermodesulfobacteriota bacterium]